MVPMRMNTRQGRIGSLTVPHVTPCLSVQTSP